MAEHKNAQMLRTGYEAFEKGDLDTVRGLFAEDIMWHSPGNNIISGDYKGVDEVFGLFGRIFQETGGLHQEIHDVLANDDHAAVLIHVKAERNGKTLDQNGVHVWHINSEGKPTEFWGFAEDPEASDEFWS